jgi:hypothetical protein
MLNSFVLCSFKLKNTTIKWRIDINLVKKVSDDLQQEVE